MTATFEPLETRRFLSVTPTLPPAGGGSAIHLLANDTQPSIAGVDPANGATGVSTNTSVKVDVNLPNVGHGVSDASVKATGNVTLTRVSDLVTVQANVNTTGGGDAIILTPLTALDPNTLYRFNVTDKVKDTSGAAFTPFSSTFTTGAADAGVSADIRFDKIELPTTFGYQWTSVTTGPDGSLFAAARSGQIVRFHVNPDGTLGASRTIQTIRTGNGGNERLITGIEFDPRSTRTQPILYVSHGVNLLEGAANFSTKISKLTGRNLEIYQDIVTNLPRSARDHLTNQLRFGPDGFLYVSQGSMSAQGDRDSQWGLRDETRLSAAILQINVNAISSPVNVKTTDAGGSYNPYAAGAPVRLYATGVRNAYDLVWTRDGQLFAATNSSAKGGNAPAGNGAAALTNIPTQNDYLYHVENGGYYGHPNPARGQFVLNGGNPTSRADSAEITQYAVGTQPEANYRGIAYDFGRNESPDGIIEFSSSTKVFGGALNNKLMVAQYSGGDNIIVLTRDPVTGNITKGETGFAGLTQFVDPLDLVQHPKNGFIYVAEYGASRITLLRPEQSKLLSGRRIRTDADLLVFNDVKGGDRSSPQTIKLWNRGTRGLTISSITLTGDDKSQFRITEAPTRPFDLAPGHFAMVGIAFTATAGTSTGLKTATLRIASNDTAGDATRNIVLQGLATPGLEGENEPSLTRILQAYDLDVDVGDDDPAEADIPLPPRSSSDEITAQSFVKAAAGNVTIETLAVFAPNFDAHVADVGYYNVGSASAATTIFSANEDSNQTVDPLLTGWNQFDPGANRFGLFVLWPQRNNRITYSDDSLNTWDDSIANGRKLRVYPLRHDDGTIEANAYVVGAEAIPDPVDHQDIAFIIRNVAPVSNRPANASTPPGLSGSGLAFASAPTPLPAALPSVQPVFGAVRIDPGELV